MPLDPRARALIEQAEAANLPPVTALTPGEARDQMEFGTAALGKGPVLPRVEDRTIPGPGGRIPIRVYGPAAPAPLPALVYYHGGGWVQGSLNTHDALCRTIAYEAGAVVVAVDYRLAPEHKFPAAAEDAYAAAAWVVEHADDLGIDAGRVSVGGDSAGGNLAAVAALMARDRGGPRFASQVLIYPITDHDFETPSYRENAEGYFLTRDAMVWFWNHYLARPEDGRHPYASPLRAEDFSGLPPALVITAEYDPLRDEGEAYAERLKGAGVPVVPTRYDGMIHGFIRRPLTFPQAGQAVTQVARIVRDGLPA